MDILFTSDGKYGVSTVPIRDFLICDYKIADPISEEIIRDRDWMMNLISLDAYCIVPSKIQIEIPIIKKFLARKLNL